MGSLHLFTIGKAAHNAELKGNKETQEKLKWFYKKYQKVHAHDKEYIWGQFLDYCRVEEIDISEPLLDDSYKKVS